MNSQMVLMIEWTEIGYLDIEDDVEVQPETGARMGFREKVGQHTNLTSQPPLRWSPRVTRVLLRDY